MGSIRGLHGHDAPPLYVGVFARNESNRLLVIKEAKGPWHLPYGVREANETPLRIARRAIEDTGLAFALGRGNAPKTRWHGDNGSKVEGVEPESYPGYQRATWVEGRLEAVLAKAGVEQTYVYAETAYRLLSKEGTLPFSGKCALYELAMKDYRQGIPTEDSPRLEALDGLMVAQAIPLAG